MDVSMRHPSLARILAVSQPNPHRPLRNASGGLVGRVVFADVGANTLVTVTLDLPASAEDSIHGFHVHANGDPANGDGCIADPGQPANTHFVSADGHYNPGGEMVMWTSVDRGTTWTQGKQLTRNSSRNHTYARRPLDAHPDFYALWADGHAREPSESHLYFTDQQGTHVWRLPAKMERPAAKPEVAW